MASIHISRRGSVNITRQASNDDGITSSKDINIQQLETSASKLEASRTKLAELQRKSRNLSASLMKNEMIMTSLASDTAAVEAQARQQVARRLDSPGFIKYANSSLLESSKASTDIPPINFQDEDVSAEKRKIDAAYVEGFERQKELLKREMAVALARDLSDSRARNEELQHANAMKEVQLRVCESEVKRLRDSELRLRESISSLSQSQLDLKSHLDRQQDLLDQSTRRTQTAETEAESLLEKLNKARQLLTTEKVEREALARQVIALTDERKSLLREVTALRESESRAVGDIRKERELLHYYQTETRAEVEELQQELQNSISDAADYRASAISFRVRAEESEALLEQNTQVHVS
jgi:hypothetical protein